MRVAPRNRQRIAVAVAGGLVTFAGAFAMVQATASAAQERSLVFSLESSEWTKPYDGPLGFPKGSQASSLGFDPISNGETYYARFPAGSHFEPHWHSYAEYATVLRGKVTLTLGAERYSLVASDYVVIPARMTHEWKVDSSGEMVLLVRRDGPEDYNWVEP